MLFGSREPCLMKRLVLTIAMLIVLAAPAWAGFDEGVAAYTRGEYATALREFRPLAEQGDPRAQGYLGFMYSHGQGVPQDYAEAVKWYRKAAAQGQAHAQNNLGFMYGNGQGVPQDYVQAHFWFNLAASHVPPGTFRDMAVENRDVFATKMTPAQIAEAQRMAREWTEKHGKRE